MSEIKAGDLVMVVRAQPCCGGAKSIGEVFRVKMIVTVPARCEMCGDISVRTLAALKVGSGCEVSRLIRIDPPAQPESIETDREVVA